MGSAYPGTKRLSGVKKMTTAINPIATRISEEKYIDVQEGKPVGAYFLQGLILAED